MTAKRKNEARRWFQQAGFDLQATRWNIKGGYYSTACFLAQQAGEKALKSFLYYQGARRSALFTRPLVEMVLGGKKQFKKLENLLDQARELDLHYIPSRYPNGIPRGYPHQFYGKRTADQALASAEKIFTVVQGYYQSRDEKEILEE